MGMALKLIVALCLGTAMLFGAQRLWVSAITAQIAARPPVPLAAQIKPRPTPTIDPARLRAAINPGLGKMIDTTTGQRLAVEGAARRIDLLNRAAQSAVPLPRHYPGMPRY